MPVARSFILSYIRRGESHWWMKGSTPPQIAEIIIKLVKDMAAVSFFLAIPPFISDKTRSKRSCVAQRKCL